MKKFLTGILVSTMVLGAMTVSVAVEVDENPYVDASVMQSETLSSGSCGENATYTFDEETGTLTISGSGEMEAFIYTNAPWSSYRQNIKSVNIEPGITSVGNKAFYYATSLTSIVLPDSIVTINNYAFEHCVSLTSVAIPDLVSSIGNGAFYACNSLTSITIPENITNIGQLTFWGCSSLSSLTIPQKVTSIGQEAFSYCSDFSSMVIPDSVVSMGKYTFRNCISLTSIFIPSSVIEIGLESFHQTTYDETELKSFLLDNLTVYGFADSYIESYCAEDGIPFIAVTEVPDWATNNSTTTQTTPEIPDWAKTYTDFVADTIMPDISGSNYGENSTRGLIAQSLYNMCGNGAEASDHGFVDAGDYDTAIAWCKENSVMNGMDDTTFGTDSNVTREQFALILMQLANSLEKTTIPSDASVFEGFHDVDSISDWATHGVAWAIANGLMEGSDGILNPSGNITRAEVAVMLYNFDKL